VKENAWSEMELTPLRERLRSPVRRVLAGAQIFVCCGLIFATTYGMHYASLLWTLILPLQTMARLYQIVKPVSRTGLLEERSLVPIYSEHWGESRQDRSLSL
jgi:hypothetical protein